MNRSDIDGNHVVARYLADQLPDADREAFESFFVDHPDIVQELEATARLKAGLMQLRDSGELATLLLQRPCHKAAKESPRLSLLQPARRLQESGLVDLERLPTAKERDVGLLRNRK